MNTEDIQQQEQITENESGRQQVKYKENTAAEKKRISKVMLHWFLRRLKSVFERDHRFWRQASLGIWIFSCLSALSLGAGLPIGMGIMYELTLVMLINALCFILTSAVIACLLSLLYLPVPRFFLSSIIYLGVTAYFILDFGRFGWQMALVWASIYTLLSLVISLVMAVLLSRQLSAWTKSLITASVVIGLAVSFTLGLGGKDSQYPEQFITEVGNVLPITAQNPSEPGQYDYTFFTYGSGRDLHRKEFSQGATLISNTVDASEYINQNRWPRIRERFWGFNEHALPLNGRVWMPEGEGSFPLVLIVHGNSLMERFSDEGYAYLGELLASRGMIAISVDENFLNYSQWSGTPNQDMLVRSWILLQHLQQIQYFDQQRGTAFYQKVNWDKIGMIGHSRGGQAVAMASDYKRWFEDDLESLPVLDTASIEAVIALAPTDSRVNDQQTRIHDVHYLTIQGSKDADVSNFHGERQYNRTTIPADSNRFKAALYIGGANHSHFNSDWGTLDMRPPGGLFLNLRNIMSQQDQQKIAEVYISAFLETALLDNGDYRGLFRDYRKGMDWLPQTRYFSRFEDGQFRELTRFEQTREAPEKVDGLAIEIEGDMELEIANAQDRRGRSKGTKGGLLEWQEPASFSLQLSEAAGSYTQQEQPTHLVFSAANYDRDIESEQGYKEVLIQLELTDEEGNSARVPMDSYMSIYPSVFTTFTRLPGLETRIKRGAYPEAAEPIFQTIEIPLEAFVEENNRFDPQQLQLITFHFVSPTGKVMLDDIGLASQ